MSAEEPDSTAPESPAPDSAAPESPPPAATETAAAETAAAEPAAAPEPATTAANTGPLGQERGIGFVIVLTLVTLGIYAIYWLWVSYGEVKRHRGEGVGSLLGILLCLVIVGYFKLPQYVGRMYAAEGNQNPPVSGLSGLWIFVPYVGTFIWLAKLQGALNAYWRAKGVGTVATVPASTTTF